MRIDAAAHHRHAFAVEGRRFRAIGAIGHATQQLAHLTRQRIVAKVTGRRHDHAARSVTALKKSRKSAALKTIDGFFPAADRPGDRMILEEIQAEQIVHVIIRRIFRL